MHGVRVKRVNATEARRTWFSLLDEVAGGNIVILERTGRRLVLRREDRRGGRRSPAVPDYSDVLRTPDLEQADAWTWDWRGPGRLTALPDGTR
ncbi:MAG: hypothetical protein HY905_06515 [Deltaproteobacteria bacterium]|nr:hypothetical protein [Deltaproteobacteria bacterium]